MVKMELDKRIKVLSDILTCFDVERAREFLGEKGYFGDLYCFTDLQRECPYGTLADVLVTRTMYSGGEKITFTTRVLFLNVR